MPQLQRLRVEWSGTGVTGPGLSTFYFSTGATSVADSVETFFNAIKANIPSSVTITVPSSGDLIDDETGVLEGVWSDPGTGGVVVGTFTGDYAQGVGARVSWATAGIYRGRRVKGNTFIVPIGAGLFGLNGLLDPATQSAILAAAQALLTAEPTMKIWSRPNDNGTPTAGISSTVVAASVPNQVTWLRSRRT